MKKKSIVDRLIFACVIAVLCVTALLTRKANGMSPNFFNTYFPDTAWTMAVYCGFGFLLNRGVKLNLPLALGFSYLIEISQLFSPAILVAIRSTTLGGLIFGYGFLWSDIACYTVGALICAGVELVIKKCVITGSDFEVISNSE